MPDAPTIVRLGDDALIVRFANTISWDVGARVRAAAARVRALKIGSVVDVVPAYTTIAVYFDCAVVSFDTVAEAIAPAVNASGSALSVEPALIEIPVRYDGPDLVEVADRTGLTVADVIVRHSTRTYRAYMSGFVPGFAYLGDLDPLLEVARRSVPRVRVPAGSVAIAAAQTAVYPLETPGGWHLIGSTALTMFDVGRDPPALIRAGDSVRFVPVDA
ncbi:MAG: 5-oxoprolinase subunit PxpB [Gemmatimonadaceae bacterium]